MSNLKEEMPVSVAMALCIILIFAPVVLGDYAELPELKAVGYSVCIGVFIAFLGYAKTDPLESFNAVHFVVTPITGIFTGIVMVYLNYSYAEAITWLANAGVLVLLDFIGKALVRRFWRPSTATLYTASAQANSEKG